jgi:ribonuclease VapC
LIVDTSALVAILFREEGFARLLERLGEGPRPGIGPPTLLEARIVLSARMGPAGSTLLARLVDSSSLETIPYTEDHADAALEAFLRFGKGRHPAALNFGDCMSYATARVAREPLLCVGGDFAQTDLELVPLR